MRFIHAADLHLGTPFQGLAHLPENIKRALQEAPYQAYEQLVDHAIKKNVDFVCLAGDIFDQGGLNIKAQVRFKQGLDRLNEHNIPVVMIYGNHDYLISQEHALPYPENTYLLSAAGETVKLTLQSREIVAVSGFSYARRHISEERINDLPDRLSDSDFHIGLWHGQVEQVLSSDNIYAPVTIRDLEAKHYDYWALGHIHRRQSLDKDGRINYSGCIQGRHINESGRKGIYLVESQSGQWKATFLETSPIIFETVTCHFDQPVQSLDTIYKGIESKMLALREQHQKLLIKIQLSFDQAPSPAIYQQINDPSFKEAFSQILATDHFYWVFDLSWVIDETSRPQTHFAHVSQEDLNDLLVQLQDGNVFEQETQELFDKLPLDYYYQTFDEAKIEEILHSALKWL